MRQSCSGRLVAPIPFRAPAHTAAPLKGRPISRIAPRRYQVQLELTRSYEVDAASRWSSHEEEPAPTEEGSRDRPKRADGQSQALIRARDAVMDNARKGTLPPPQRLSAIPPYALGEAIHVSVLGGNGRGVGVTDQAALFVTFQLEWWAQQFNVVPSF